VQGHVETVPRKNFGWTVQHIKLSEGQKRTLEERRWAKHQERIDWIESRHGELSKLGTGFYADGTHWKEAEGEWQEHLKEKDNEVL